MRVTKDIQHTPFDIYEFTLHIFSHDLKHQTSLHYPNKNRARARFMLKICTHKCCTENDLRECKTEYKTKGIEMFVGEKTWVFWVGLIILASASVVLFGIIWYNAITNRYYKPAVEFQVPFIVGAVVFIFIGLYMMTSGVKKKNT